MSSKSHQLPTVVILAGGLAQRLRPITETIPKAMVEVAGAPFIYHQLERLKKQGVFDVVLCLGYQGNQIEDYVGDGSRFGLHVKYAYDGEKLLGTGGAIRNALPLLGDVFYVTYGDTLLDVSYRDVFECFLKSQNAFGIMTVLKNQNRWDRSNTEYVAESESRKIISYHKKNPTPKMQYIDYGLSIFRKSAIENWFATKDRESLIDLSDLLTDFANHGKLQGFEVTKRFYEIGTPESLKETSNMIEENSKKEKTQMDKSIKQYIQTYMSEAAQLCQILDVSQMENMVQIMTEVRSQGGRLFFLGVGGSAANASHAVNDFRKIAGIESYSPTDNVSELTARINDDGWATSFSNWLMGSRLSNRDAVFVFSVGGGNEAKNVSPNIVTALKFAKERGAKIMGIVGRDGGYTAQVADACVIIPTLNKETITPHAEAFQAVVWHMLVSHPAMRVNEMKWESIRAPEASAGHA